MSFKNRVVEWSGFSFLVHVLVSVVSCDEVVSDCSCFLLNSSKGEKQTMSASY
ncbi:unnamed protein product [Arabidopsis halleri]